MDSCAECGCTLLGGSVKHTRQVLHIPIAPVEVIEHVYLERECPQCGKVNLPEVALGGEVAGTSRVSAQTMALIAALREVERLPIRTIQWQLATFHRLVLSVGEIVTEVLGEDFEGVLVSDFYGGYNRMRGRHQRCWAHRLRDVHDLKEKWPQDTDLEEWAKGVNALYHRALDGGADHQEVEEIERVAAQRRFEEELMGRCRPYLKSERPQRVLCVRVEKFLPELFVFVADPRVPSTNNAAERALRPVVISRKISGGTQTAEGSKTKGSLASAFGTWMAQGLNPFMACLAMLTTSPPNPMGGSIGVPVPNS